MVLKFSALSYFEMHVVREIGSSSDSGSSTLMKLWSTVDHNRDKYGKIWSIAQKYNRQFEKHNPRPNACVVLSLFCLPSLSCLLVTVMDMKQLMAAFKIGIIIINTKNANSF